MSKPEAALDEAEHSEDGRILQWEPRGMKALLWLLRERANRDTDPKEGEWVGAA